MTKKPFDPSACAANPSDDQPAFLRCSLAVIGDKWTGLIVGELAPGPKRFSELERALAGISPRTLSQRLESLQEAKILTKKSYDKVPPHIEYALTPKGQDLFPILDQMATWGQKYLD